MSWGIAKMNNRLPTIEELLKFMIDSGLELFSKSDNNLVVKNEDLTIRATFYDGTYEGTIDFSVKKKNGGHSLQERLTSFVSIKEIVNIILNETNPEIKFYSIINDIKNITAAYRPKKKKKVSSWNRHNVTIQVFE